jgi:hypothetical protein
MLWKVVIKLSLTVGALLLVNLISKLAWMPAYISNFGWDKNVWEGFIILVLIFLLLTVGIWVL